MKRSKRCKVCGEKVSEPHVDNCTNALRNCEFKKRGKK